MYFNVFRENKTLANFFEFTVYLTEGKLIKTIEVIVYPYLNWDVSSFFDAKSWEFHKFLTRLFGYLYL